MAHYEARQQEILTPEALRFVRALEKRFGATRNRLLHERRHRQDLFDAGGLPVFLPQTQEIRSTDWMVSPVPKDLEARSVELTGPVDRKMMINALNSGASVFMADFEDSTSPTWQNIVGGQVNLYDAVRGTISHEHADGRRYELGSETAVLMVRPRGWHLPQRARAPRSRNWPLLLSAQAGVVSRGSPLERRLCLRPGPSRDSAGNDQGDGPDRDTPGRIRDG